MDGRGAWRDNVFVERVWRSVKYEEVYLRAYDSVAEARASIGRYLALYNGKRPHSSPHHSFLHHSVGHDHSPPPIQALLGFSLPESELSAAGTT